MDIQLLPGNLVVKDDDGHDLFTEARRLQRRIRSLICVLSFPRSGLTAAELKPLLWTPGECRDPTSALTSLIHNARRVLPEGRLATSPPGKGPRRYLLRLGDIDTVDATQFTNALSIAKRFWSEGNIQVAALHYSQSLESWPIRASAEPLIDFPKTRSMLLKRDELLALRREAVERYAEIQLKLGRHTTRLADEILQSILADENVQSIRMSPTNAHLWRLYIIALYRAGYRGEALMAHKRMSEQFALKFQAGPGRDLDRLREQILCEDPILWTEVAVKATINQENSRLRF